MPRHRRTCPARPAFLHVKSAFNRLAVVFLLLVFVGAHSARAEPQNWSVHAFGFKVGELHLNMRETQARYSGSGTFHTTGLAGVLRHIRLSVTAQGRLDGRRLKPSAYDGLIDTGRRLSETRLEFSAGTPRKVTGKQSPATPIAKSALRGALDPMSMMWTTLRDQTPGTLCKLDHTQYDGTRLVHITLTTRTGDANTVTCSGSYDRIGGYSAAELAELKTSPLSVTYQRHSDVWQARRIRLTSRHGQATLYRRD